MKFSNLKSFISKISENKAFKNTAEDISSWSNLPHNIMGLDLLLQNAIVELEVFSKKSKRVIKYLCSSNLHILSKLTEIDINDFRKREIALLKQKPISTISYNFNRNSLFTISGEDWEIKSFIIVKPENTEILNKILRNTEFKK